MEIKHENVQNPDTNASTGARTSRSKRGGCGESRGAGEQVDPCLVSKGDTDNVAN